MEERDLLVCASERWSTLCNRRIRITYGKSKKLHTVTVSFHKEEFAHLAGFQYLRDLGNVHHYKSEQILKYISERKITLEMISKSKRYEEMVYPRLVALNSISADLSDEISIFLYRPDRYPFRTTIRADYLISMKSADISFVFLIQDKIYADYSCCSTFMKEQRDYEINQERLCILKKEVLLDGSDEWTEIFRHPHLIEKEEESDKKSAS